MKSRKHFEPIVYILACVYALFFILAGTFLMKVKNDNEATLTDTTVEETTEDSVADLDLDLNTLCSQANQFGLTQLSTVYFEDGSAVVLTDKSTQVDNKIGRGHVVSFSPGNWLEGWFDTNNNAVYATFGNGEDITSDWFVTTVGEHEDLLTQYLTVNLDYNKVIEDVHNRVVLFEELNYKKTVTSDGIWYYSDITSDVNLSSIGQIPKRTVMQVFVPNNQDVVTQVDVILYYDKNDMGATHEVYEFEVVFTNDCCCEVPAIVTEAVGNYEDQLTLYNEMMR